METTTTSNEALCARIQAGDPDALDELLRQNQDFIFSTANSIYNQSRELCRSLSLEPEDLAQIAMLHLSQKIHAYSPDRDASFLTFCSPVIRNAMIDELRQKSRSSAMELHLAPISLEYLIAQADSDQPTPYFTQTPEQIYLKKEQLQELHEALASLTERDQSYLAYRFGFDTGIEQTVNHAAKHFRISSSRGQKMEKTAFRHLREQLRQRG